MTSMYNDTSRVLGEYHNKVAHEIGWLEDEGLGERYDTVTADVIEILVLLGYEPHSPDNLGRPIDNDLQTLLVLAGNLSDRVANLFGYLTANPEIFDNLAANKDS